MNPKLVQRAVRMTCVIRKDGSYHVNGDTGTRTVYVASSGVGNSFYCDCPAGRTGNTCAHALCVSFHLQNQAKAAAKPASLSI